MFSHPVKRVGINQYSTVFSCSPNTLLSVLLHLPLNKVLTKYRKTHHLFIISPLLINNCHCHWFFLSHTLSFFCPSFSPVLSIMPTSLECVRSLYYKLCVHNGTLCAMSVLWQYFILISKRCSSVYMQFTCHATVPQLGRFTEIKPSIVSFVCLVCDRSPSVSPTIHEKSNTLLKSPCSHLHILMS